MLLITGPANNIASNYREMSKSLTCGDELGFNASQGLKSLVQDAQYAILDTMDDTVDIVIDAVEVRQKIAFDLKLDFAATDISYNFRQLKKFIKLSLKPWKA